MKRIAILGSTGSIGQSALAVVDAHPDRLAVVGLAGGTNAALLARQADRYRPRALAMASPEALDAVRDALSAEGRSGVGSMGHGGPGLVDVATHPDVDVLLCASSGTAALEAVLAAIRAGKTIALANKEVLVMAGRLVTDAARRHGVSILPVDSEHNAIHQCMHGRAAVELRRLILTASGGPFREVPMDTLDAMTPAEALRHPTWRMGSKITIDSATMMNKGLEVIEAHWLFGVADRQIDVLVHPQSIVHSMVELRDGSVIAQLGVTDMRLPIQYAFSYPDRWDAALPSLDLVRCGPLEFSTPDLHRFPCLALAYEALRGEGAMPVALNAANEVAVEAFLAGRLGFTGIARAIAGTLVEMTRRGHGTPETLDAVRQVDEEARTFSQELVGRLQSS